MFCRGKVPFIFNQEAFITSCSSALKNNITGFLDPLQLDTIARRTGFLQRTSKLKPKEFIDTLMFSEFDHSRLSLQDCCNDLAHQHQKSLSKVALHKRFNEHSFSFLKSVLAEQITQKLDIKSGKDWKPFTRVMITDSCKFALPQQYKDDYPGFGGARSKALMNMQYAFDLKQGNWETLELTKVSENDKAYSKRSLQDIKAGDLHIRDLGYVTHGYLLKISTEKAFFLNRLHPGWKPISRSTGKAINWHTLYQEMQLSKRNRFETMVTIGKGEEAFDCRLIAMPVPEKVWSERIRKAQIRAKSVGYELTDDYKYRCRFSIFITNTTIELLNATEVIQLYRLRWQIELVFKTWKSLLDMHKVKAVKKERLQCQLMAKFIWILLNWKIFRCLANFIRQNSPDNACSVWKFFKQARQCSHLLRMVVSGKLHFTIWCDLFSASVVKNLLIEPKKGKKASLHILNEVFFSLG
ncbi:IS4 family transposase [Mucilaginibacter celer]|uniref:IS4 family transposase n=1 Tax=Mucilaginibacter celer TaxID=2305508 RepID=A0A494VTN8_9SPHI|nr:IS4 family transposase [Mucilaginibacter celer]